MRPRPFLLLLAGFVLALMFAENIQAEYGEVELNRFEGQFAPDPNQNEGAVLDAAEQILNDPTQIGAVAQNLSWVEYTHHFLLPPDATWLRIEITVDYTLGNESESPQEGPAGSLDLTFHSPDGEQMCRDERDPPCFEIVYFDDNEKEIDGYTAQLAPVPGEWTLTVSGSGFEGLLGELIYSGNYKLVVMTELNTPKDSGDLQRLPAPSLAAAVAAVAVIALRRPRKP